MAVKRRSERTIINFPVAVVASPKKFEQYITQIQWMLACGHRWLRMLERYGAAKPHIQSHAVILITGGNIATACFKPPIAA